MVVCSVLAYESRGRHYNGGLFRVKTCMTVASIKWGTWFKQAYRLTVCMGVVWGQNWAYIVAYYGACYQGMRLGRWSIPRRHVDWCIKLGNFVKSFGSEGKVSCKFVELWRVRPEGRVHHWDKTWSKVLDRANTDEAPLILARGQYVVFNDKQVIGHTSEKLRGANLESWVVERSHLWGTCG